MVNKLKASIELTLLVFIMVLFIIGIGIYGILEIRQLNNSSKELYNDRMLPMDQLADIRFYTSTIIATAHQIDNKQISYSEALQKLTQAQDSIKVNWKNYRLTYLTDKEKKLVSEMAIKIDQTNNTIEKLILILKKEDNSLLHSILKNELYSGLNSVIINTSNLLHLQVEIGNKINKNNDEVYSSYTQKFLWILFVTFVFALPFTYYLIKKNGIIISSLNLNKAKLFLTEKNYRNLIEYAGEAILILNEETEIIDLNDAACVLLGYTREELLKMRISNLVSPEDIEKQKEDINSVKSNKFAIINRKIKRKDGVFIETEISNRLMEGKGFFAIIRDITERKKAEETIKKSEEKYRYLFDNNPAYIIIWDLETLNVLEVNESVYEKYGYSRAEWTNMSVLDIRPVEDQQKVKLFAEKMLHGNEEVVRKIWTHTKKCGEEMLMEIASHKIKYNNRKAVLSLAKDITAQAKAEAQLIEREAQLDLFIEHSPASLAMFDINMCYLVTSRRWIVDYNLLGQDIIGKSHYEVFPEIGQEWKDIHQRCLHGAIEKREEDSFLRANGTVDWMKWEIRPWYKSSNEIGGIIMFTEVITEHKKATELFKKQFENSPDTILYVNQFYKIEAINRVHPNLGMMEDVIGSDCIEVLPEESRQLAKEALQKCFATKESQEIENGLNFERWVRSRIVPVIVNDEVTHVMIFATDLSERKKAELKLKQSEEKHRILTENISDAIALVNKNLEIDYQSPSAERILGYNNEETELKSIFKFIHPDDFERLRDFYDECYKLPGIPMQNQFRFMHKEGHIIWVEGTVLNLLGDGNIEAFIVNYRDITERKKHENDLIHYNAELKKTNSELDRFVYSTSHDLRAPLKSMLGLIFITKESIEKEDVVLGKRLTMLEESVLKLDDFIEDILNYSRNARIESDANEIDFEKMIQHIKGSYKFIDGLKDLDLRVNLNSSERFISDAGRISIIFNNIISNAIKYRDSLKKISFLNISINCCENKAIIVIEDNGIGILEKEKEKVFEMFYRATTVSTGSGLGLYIVKETIGRLGGEIEVESELEKGTKITIEIPNRISILN